MYRLLGLLLLPAVLLFGCSGEGKCPSGSECTNVSCACTDVKCELYPDPDPAVRITYSNGTDNSIKLVISIKGIGSVEGHEYSGNEMLNNNTVTLYSVGNDGTWPEFTDQSHCKIDTFGGANSQLEGSCTFIFHYAGTGDFNASLPFSCTLEPVILQ